MSGAVRHRDLHSQPKDRCEWWLEMDSIVALAKRACRHPDETEEPVCHYDELLLRTSDQLRGRAACMLPQNVYSNASEREVSLKGHQPANHTGRLHHVSSNGPHMA